MPTFWQQFKILLWKNILLKRRNKQQLIQEVLFPVYFILILAMIKGFLTLDPNPAVENIPEYPLQNASHKAHFNKLILVSPDNSYVRSVANSSIDILKGLMNLSYTPELKYYNSTSQLTTEYEAEGKNVSAGIVFEYAPGNKLTYAIRMSDSIADTETIYKDKSSCRGADGLDDSGCGTNSYLHLGFTVLQAAVDAALIRDFIADPYIAVPEISVQMIPKTKYQPDTSYIQIISSIYFIIAYSQFISFLSVNLVAEKEKKIKEAMKIMGMRDSAFWLSWTVVYFVIILVVTVIVIVIAVASSFFQNSNVFIFFLILILYGASIITLAFVFTPFFQKAQTAGGLTGMATMVISLLYLVVSLTREISSTGEVTHSIPPVGRYFLSLLSPVGAALAIDQAILLDITVGMNFDTILEGDFPLIAPMMMLILDTVLYLLLAMYLENVIPGNYGPRFSPLYCFSKSYWFGDEESKYSQGKHDDKEAFFGKDVENVTDELREKTAIRLYNICKVFKTKEETVNAVDGLSLEMYEGQITCLLGHNGAGKTTLINMLSGLMAPTEGTASIMGFDISNSNDMLKIRNMTGVCPQHNVLFDVLTCEEHLRLYAGLKGISEEVMQGKKSYRSLQIAQSLKDVDLYDKRETYAKDLSGGQKRKLSVAIALIADPKIIFLDEPTAGMDPFSRRHLWNILKEKRQGKVILLTTHFMDEADILADRKAILSKGKLKCCGSSLFLKNRFGIGYHLDMVKDPACDVPGVTGMVKNFVPGAKLERQHGKELAYTLPLNDAPSFAELFTELERPVTSVSNKAESMGIKSYGVSMTSLEEVFLKLEEDETVMDVNESETNGTQRIEANNAMERLTITSSDEAVVDVSNADVLDIAKDSENLSSRQFWTLFKMRWIRLLRNKPVLVINLFFPVIFVVVGLMVNKFTADKNNNTDPVPLNLTETLVKYARFNNSAVPDFIPPLLTRDTAYTMESEMFFENVQTFYYTNPFVNKSQLLSMAPHYLGIDLTKFTLHLMGMTIESGYTILYNSTALHALPVMVNFFSNSLLNTEAALKNVNASLISVVSLPWPTENNKPEYSQAAFSATILLAMAFITIGPGFAVDLVKDRQSKCRTQLRVAGVSTTIYWSSNFAADLLKFCIPGVLTIIFTLAVQVESLNDGGAVLSLILLIVTYIPAGTLFAYVFSFAFKKFETAQGFLTTIFILLGLLPYMAVSLVDMLTRSTAAAIVHYILCIIDCPYTIFGGLYYIDRIYRNRAFEGIGFYKYFEFGSHIPIAYISCIIQIVFYFYLLRMLDIKSTGGKMKDGLPWAKSNQVSIDNFKVQSNTDVIEGEDSDVTEERERIKHIQQRSGTEHFPVSLAQNLRKEFPQSGKGKACSCCSRKNANQETDSNVKVAVRNVTFAVDCGEVFGLLGPNGAGKTTTLNMMIADIGPTAGQVMVGGYDIKSCMSDAFQAMGYCPQHDALWDTITLEEHIQNYAVIRGVPQHEIQRISDWFVHSLKIEEHAKKLSKKLSGGTKRKLSYAISMLGKPKVVLLDEPSTGMDPSSKRFLWDTISSSFSGKERGAILTTHYMEEADALCSRIGIMVNGKLDCIGASQHLKNKYGSGYLLEVKLHKASDMNEERFSEKMNSLEGYIKSLFPSATRAERFGVRTQYKVPRDNVTSLASTFSALEAGKSSHDIEEYSFSQPTLEQVFLEFAKKQLGEVENETKTDKDKTIDEDAESENDQESGPDGNITHSIRL